MIYFTIITLAIILAVMLLVSIAFRTVVETNKVHIVQSSKKRVSYGANQPAGNVYYHWPSWIPFIGLKIKELPVSNFELELKDYEAYDEDRVPFELDVVAFFRICDTNLAAERLETYEHLKQQLLFIVKGSIRKILASNSIEKIMTDRATFGEQFTQEVKEELTKWGAEPVKNMELMDIRDTQGNKNIANIMAKKSSHIAMESRKAVAKNNQEAKVAEIEATQIENLRQQEADQLVGQRIAEKTKLVGIAEQVSTQEVKMQEAITAEKRMDVLKVEQVRQAEITREAALVGADQARQTTVIAAEGQLNATKLHAEGVSIAGKAEGDAQTAVLLAPVNAQITLAKEIGQNEGYQGYLVALKTIEAYLAVGTKQAEALTRADVKIIATAGNAVTGINNAMELFTPQGGLAVGSMIEAFGNTQEGGALLKAIKARLTPVVVDKDIKTLSE